MVAAEEMTQVRRSLGIAGISWFAMHVVHAVTLADRHPRPWLLVLALSIAALAHAAALYPLVRPQVPPLTRSQVVALAASPAVVALLVQPHLERAALTSYANWPMGGMSTLIAALALRCGPVCSGVSAAGLIAVNTGALAAHPPLDVRAAAQLAVSPVLFWAAAVGSLWLVRRSEGLALAYTGLGDALDAEAREESLVRQATERRAREIAAQVTPLLQRVVDRGVDEETRVEAVRLSQAMRDTLRARALVDAELRPAVAAARARGVEVVLSVDVRGEGPPGALIERLREALQLVLPDLPPGSRVTCRVNAAHIGTCVLHVDDDETLRRHGQLLADIGFETQPDLIGGLLIARLAADAVTPD